MGMKRVEEMSEDELIKKAREMRHGDKDQMAMSMPDLLDTLSKQKTDLTRTMRKELWESQSVERRTRLRQRALEDPAPLPEPPNPSNFRGAEKYSFGKPRHLKGKFKMLTLNSRDPDHVHRPGGVNVPGAGTYQHPHTVGTSTELGEPNGGATGGWHMRDHEIFLQTLAEFEKKTKVRGNPTEEVCSPEFMDKLSHRLGGDTIMPRAALVDHLRWFAHFEKEAAAKQRRVARWREQHVDDSQMGQTADIGAIERERRRERATEVSRARELHAQADCEEERWGGCGRRYPTILPVQCVHGEVVDSNFRGHAEFRKSPGYTFGSSTEIRDGRDSRFSNLSHVRSSSHLDNTGPGQYMKRHLEEPNVLMKRSSSWCFGKKLPAQKVDQTTHAGPGYDGPNDADKELSKDIQTLQFKKPVCVFGNDGARHMFNSNEMHSIVDKFSTPDQVGPGRYGHAMSLRSQF